MTTPVPTGVGDLEPGWSAGEPDSYGPRYQRHVPGKGILRVVAREDAGRGYAWYLSTDPSDPLTWPQEGFARPRDAMRDADRRVPLLPQRMFEPLTPGEARELYRKLARAHDWGQGPRRHTELAAVRLDLAIQITIQATDPSYEGPDPHAFRHAVEQASYGASAQAMEASPNRGSWLSMLPSSGRWPLTPRRRAVNLPPGNSASHAAAEQALGEPPIAAAGLEAARHHADWMRIGNFEDSKNSQTGTKTSSLSRIGDFGATVNERFDGTFQHPHSSFDWTINRQRTEREGPDERGSHWEGPLASGTEPTMAKARSVALSAMKRLRAEHIAGGGDVGYGEAPTGDQIRAVTNAAPDRNQSAATRLTGGRDFLDNLANGVPGRTVGAQRTASQPNRPVTPRRTP